MAPVTLFLFDLDGTLVSTGGAGIRALGKAFQEIFDIADAHKNVNPSGKTDPAIFREILSVVFKREPKDGELDLIADTYLRHLETEMKNSTTKPLKGVSDFVQHLSDKNEIVMGLGTGNLEKGARLKLQPTELNPHFSFGGFGSDAEERSEVLRHGHRRAIKISGQDIPNERVYIIGDTPLDVSAAKRAGFKSVAVASGRSTVADLRVGNPDFVWSDMSEGREFLKGIK